MEKLAEQDFVIEYRPAEEMVVPDSMTRRTQDGYEEKFGEYQPLLPRNRFGPKALADIDKDPGRAGPVNKASTPRNAVPLRSKDDETGSRPSGLDRPKNDRSDDSGEASYGRGSEALLARASDKEIGAYAGPKGNQDRKSADGDKPGGKGESPKNSPKLDSHPSRSGRNYADRECPNTDPERFRLSPISVSGDGPGRQTPARTPHTSMESERKLR